jgi:ribosomal protein S18 acetylase RimI-like enzyme
MEASDLAQCRALWEVSEGMRLSEGDSAEELTGYLRRNPSTSQVAFLEGKLVGAVLAGHDGHRGLLYHLAVSKETRGQGIGGDLVERSLKALKSEGIARVLILVLADNEAGRQFWSRQGFEGIAIAAPMGISL